MFFDYKHSSIRYTGRFSEYTVTRGEENRETTAMTATATGSYIEIAFRGDKIVLYFEDKDFCVPFPHIWVQLDGGAKFEAAITGIIQVDCEQDCAHTIKIVFKGAKEAQQRFMLPLSSKLSFKGYDAKDSNILPEDNRKTIELVGDSITEGTWVDRQIVRDGLSHRDFEPCINDCHGTYAYNLVKHYNLRPLHSAYGGVGVCKAWSQEVPVTKYGYPYCFEGAPVTYGHPDYILINLGTNDAGNIPLEEFVDEYRNALTLIRSTHPDSVIICCTPFSGSYEKDIPEIVYSFNDSKMHCISTAWGREYDIHPSREQHKVIADKLIEAVRDIIK